MEFPAQSTDSIFFLIILLLAVMPIATIIASTFITRVFLSDTDRPRNKIIKRMMQSGWSIAAASVLVAALAIDILRHAVILHEPINADFGGVMIAFAFLVLEVQPFLNYWELRKLRYPEVIARGETLTQKEDREAGVIRREHESIETDERHIQELTDEK